jgi:two-component system, OmpR family, sensor histidine kinase VicK
LDISLASDTTSNIHSSYSDIRRIDMVSGIQNISKSYSSLFLNAKIKIDTCINYYYLPSFSEHQSIKDLIIKLQKRGITLRCIIEITKGNIKYCKELAKLVKELRHLEGLRSNFTISESEYISLLGSSTLNEKKDKKITTEVIYSDTKSFIEEQQYLFDILWDKAIPAENQIKEIETNNFFIVKDENHTQQQTLELEQDIGLEEGIKIIRSPVKVQKLAFDLLKSAKDEILIIFSTANAFHRQEKAGSIKLLAEIASKKDNSVNIKIMTPIDDTLPDIKKELENIEIKEKVEEDKKEKIVRILKETNYKQQKSNKIEIRFIESQLQTTISILIVDKKYSLAVELKDDTKDTSIEAIGLATYSNSKSTVLSYVSMFETLWLQTELYDRLKLQDKIQREFINVAAHELRTPIQPIIAITDIIYSRSKEDREKQELLEIIMRNAKRLKRLTDDILDIAKIESQYLQIQKEWFSLEDVISSLVYQHKANLKEKEDDINLNFIIEEKNLFIKADKGRIIQVIDNLLCNAIKFTEGKAGGSITITARRTEDDSSIIVITKDTGIGIDKEILSRLFTKFATKSDKGTGLGLYISKKIVEAHGGKIWGKNNDFTDIGSEFGFIIPIE